MSPTHTNGQGAGSLGGATAIEQAKLTNPEVADTGAVRVTDLPTDIIHTPRDNEIDMEAVEELRCNMAEHGQLVEIIVFPHPTMAGHFLCADGNHRLAAKRLLGQTVRARILDKAPDEAELITIRVTTATIRKAVDKAVVGADIFRWMEITGADQFHATGHFGYTSQSAISKLLRPYTNGVEELLTALKERRIAATSAYLVAALPAEVQRAILPQVLGKKREAVQRIVQAAKGAKPKSAKVLKLSCGGVVATVKGDRVAALRTFIAKATEALKKLERDNLPPEFLGGLMQ
jgi:ParB-like chromosome segregation protein Spo0J